MNVTTSATPAITTNAMGTPALTAFVMKEGEKFVCVVDKSRIGVSKHADYFEYHLRRGDVKGLTEIGIQKFAYVDDQGNVTKIVDAETSPRRPGKAPGQTAEAQAAAAILVPKVSADLRRAAKSAKKIIEATAH